MTALRCLAAGLALVLAGSAQAGSSYMYYPSLIPTGPGKEVTCSRTTLVKEYASTKWEIHPCGDRTVDFVSTEDNPLYPYIFTVRPDVIGWDVFGQEIPDPSAAPRDRAIVKAVRRELEKLRGKDLDALVAEAASAEPVAGAEQKESKP